MKLPCTECNGLAGYYDDQNEWAECDHCENGDIERCVSAAKFPEHWKKRDGYERLMEIQADAMKCREDTRRLMHLNPKASASYERQLSEVLEKLNREADGLKLS